MCRKRRKKMAKNSVTINHLDIRSFDPVYGTVQFDFIIERKLVFGSRHGNERPKIFGSAIVTVSPQSCEGQATEQEIHNNTNIVWYRPYLPYRTEEDQNYQDSDENLKEEMRKVAYNTIWAIRRNNAKD